jgi:alpha-mannosidase
MSKSKPRSRNQNPKSRFTFHLIPNAHLDPVWLWDWREGASEALVTCRTIVDLMDGDKALTFIRGESWVYEHIERSDPATFARIKKLIKQDRWDPVGGTAIQPDANLPATETFARHYLHGQRYFLERFGRTSKVAWAADSFGHAAGLPEIFAGAGIEFFAFTRPANNIVPIEKPAFWWEGPAGSRILSYRPPVGWYGCEREEIVKRLEEILKLAPGYGLHNVAVFVGLGNHGGGPTRRQIADIRSWAAEHYPSPLLDYVRVAPTGPTIPLVLSVTTLGRKFNFALTRRIGLIDDDCARRFVESVIRRFTAEAADRPTRL